MRNGDGALAGGGGTSPSTWPTDGPGWSVVTAGGPWVGVPTAGVGGWWGGGDETKDFLDAPSGGCFGFAGMSVPSNRPQFASFVSVQADEDEQLTTSEVACEIGTLWSAWALLSACSPI